MIIGGWRNEHALSMLIISPCWGEEDSHHPPLLSSSLQTLDIGFKDSWKTSKQPIDCLRPCFPFGSVVNRQVSSDETLNYDQDFKLNLGQSGPLSFGFTGSRLKMEVEF